jgi:dTDP-4-dehydrorhamnose reductase
MKLLIIGGTGMLGHKLFQHLSETFPQTYATIRQNISKEPFKRISFLHSKRVFKDIDVSNLEALENVVFSLKPDYILNCIGIIKQHKEDAKPIPCIKINSLLPHQLVEMASKYGGRAIHFSTDCVFDGKRGLYTEEDAPNATDIYGRSKAMGEIVCDSALTLRTSIIGRELTSHLSLLDWFLRQKGTRIRGFTRAIYSGVTTNQMANIVRLILQDFPTLSGLYHVVSEPINKYDLLKLAKEIFKVNIEIKPYHDFIIDRSMKGDAFESVTGYKSPSWETLLRDIYKESGLYQSWGIEL